MGTLFQIHAGFLPILDAAILVVAREKGFAEGQGIDLTLMRETSWANIRDRMAIGHFEVAHMLAPMPIAASLGLSPMPLDIMAPMALGLGGNAVTVSRALGAEMHAQAKLRGLDATIAGRALHRAIELRAKQGKPRPVFAVVHPHSGHNYDLRYWMVASGIDPEHDVEIVILPPLMMPDAIAAGQIDGYCVGAPWNSVSVARGTGIIVTAKSRIWHSSPEKVLGVSNQFAQTNPEELAALLRALYLAAQWCGQADNRAELAEILSANNYVGVPAVMLLPALLGQFESSDGKRQQVDDFFIPFDRAATFPWKSHALWFYTQMVRWGHAHWAPDKLDTISQSYRPDIYRAALAPLNVALPAASSKVEGALTQTVPVGATHGELRLGPDGFFDGEIFDPDEITAYIKGQRA